MVADNQKQMAGLIEKLAQQEKPGDGGTESKPEAGVKSEAGNVASEAAVMETKVESEAAFAPGSVPDSAPASAPAPAPAPAPTSVPTPALENDSVAKSGSVAAMDETDSV